MPAMRPYDRNLLFKIIEIWCGFVGRLVLMITWNRQNKFDVPTPAFVKAIFKLILFACFIGQIA